MRGETSLEERMGRIEANFNPLPSCEGRPRRAIFADAPKQFQSTPLMRGETGVGGGGCAKLKLFQSTPLMRGETHPATITIRIGIFQSTPLMRGETLFGTWRAKQNGFQSTPLMRGETNFHFDYLSFSRYFNPLPSCEGRRLCSTRWSSSGNFNPLPSCEGRHISRRITTE